MLHSIELELDFYKTKLEGLQTVTLEKMVNQGSARFTNAGFQVELDLNISEIAALFNALYEAKIIKRQFSNGKELRKSELSVFIGKNFLYNNGKTPSPRNIENQLNSSNSASSNLVKKIEEVVLRLKK